MWTNSYSASPVRQAGSIKEPFYDLKPVLAVNEGPDYENKYYEEKYLFA
jgi:hypothetical protein